MVLASGHGSMNFLETLLSEWLEYNSYFVRRNIKVGKLAHGGWEGELDVVAFNPEMPHFIHYECSTDAWTKAERDVRFDKKFELGRQHVPTLFPGLDLPSLEQKVLHAYASKRQTEMGGAEVVRIQDFIIEIMNEFRKHRVENKAVPEQFPLLRTLHWAAEVTR